MSVGAKASNGGARPRRRPAHRSRRHVGATVRSFGRRVEDSILEQAARPALAGEPERIARLDVRDSSRRAAGPSSQRRGPCTSLPRSLPAARTIERASRGHELDDRRRPAAGQRPPGGCRRRRGRRRRRGLPADRRPPCAGPEQDRLDAARRCSAPSRRATTQRLQRQALRPALGVLDEGEDHRPSTPSRGSSSTTAGAAAGALADDLDRALVALRQPEPLFVGSAGAVARRRSGRSPSSSPGAGPAPTDSAAGSGPP